jgi:hypothetical protein
MKWTRERPDSDGLYWQCSDNGNAPLLVVVCGEDTWLAEDPSDVERVDSSYYCNAWWMGPIEPPPRPAELIQVTGAVSLLEDE